ncbi:MAG TPA: hypothetical protein VF903_09175, partial [Nitrospirota bacterium]
RGIYILSCSISRPLGGCRENVSWLLRKGKSIGLSDCYLAVSAKAGKAKVLTTDKQFEAIKGAADIALFDVKAGR